MTSSISSWMRGAAICAGVALAVAAVPSVANATPGSASINVPTVTAVQNEDLLTLASSGGSLTLAGSGLGSFSWSGGTGALTGMGSDGTSIITNTSLDFGNLAGLVLSSGIGTFTASSSVTIGATTYSPHVTGTTGSSGTGTETVSVYEVGDFVGAGTLAGLDQTMSMTLSFTETGAAPLGPDNLGSFSLSATVATPAAAPPAPPSVPEPASMALLASGLLGLGFVRFKHS